MGFLLKCAFWLGLAFLLLPNPARETARAPSPPRPERAAKQDRAPSRLRADKAPGPAASAAEADGAAAALAKDAAGALAAAAREKCLERPRDCLAAVDALRRAAPISSQDAR